MKAFQCSNNRSGFTLVELLVVISIIGMLSSLAVVSLNSARIKARDAKRLADVRQIQTALELYFNSNFHYAGAAGDPTGSVVATLGVDDYGCLNADGWSARPCVNPFMAFVPVNPGPGGVEYIYEMPDAAQAEYSITFALESSTPLLPAGSVVATPAGFQAITP